MRPRSLAMLALVAPLVCALVGCSGYRWLRYGGALGEVRSIAIQPLNNHSYEAGAEALVNDALLREFQRRGSVRLVKDPEHADIVLSGSLLPLITRARSFSSVAFALEYEVQMSLDLSARRTSGNVIRFGPGVLRGTEIYLASSDVEVLRKNRQEAIRRICAVLAERVHDALAEKLIADAAAPAASLTPAKPAAPAPAAP
jgi:hypothetical protein